MRVPALHNRIEFLEQRLPLFRLHPLGEIRDGIVTNEIYPLVARVVRLEKLGREVAGLMRLRRDRSGPPRQVVLDFFPRQAMRKNHRHGRLGVVVAGQQ